MAEYVNGPTLDLHWECSKEPLTTVEIHDNFATFQPVRGMRNLIIVQRQVDVRTLGIIATEHTPYRKKLEELDAMPAVAFLDDENRARYGILPRDTQFTTLSQPAGTAEAERIGARMQVSNKAARLAIGMVRKDNGVFVPACTEKVAQVLMGDMQYAYLTRY